MNHESGKIKSFTDLDAWKQGHKVVLLIYKMTKLFPKEETYGLISQMRRCVISITSNIAEGFSRQSYKEKTQFYSMAQGSTTELQNQLLVARDIRYINNDIFQEIANSTIRLHKIITGLIKRSKSLIPYS